MTKSLFERAQDAKYAIKRAGEELTKIQEECSHPKEMVGITNHSDDGYAEPTKYYRHCSCGVCGKFWVENQ